MQMFTYIEEDEGILQLYFTWWTLFLLLFFGGLYCFFGTVWRKFSFIKIVDKLENNDCEKDIVMVLFCLPEDGESRDAPNFVMVHKHEILLSFIS